VDTLRRHLNVGPWPPSDEAQAQPSGSSEKQLREQVQLELRFPRVKYQRLSDGSESHRGQRVSSGDKPKIGEYSSQTRKTYIPRRILAHRRQAGKHISILILLTGDHCWVYTRMNISARPQFIITTAKHFLFIPRLPPSCQSCPYPEEHSTRKIGESLA
jgi:hypothetical protein